MILCINFGSLSLYLKYLGVKLIKHFLLMLADEVFRVLLEPIISY